MKLLNFASLSLVGLLATVTILFGACSLPPAGNDGTGGAPGAGGTGNTCAAGQVVCGNACVDTSSDAANCGACGTSCGTGMVCSQGACSSSCAAGLQQCGQACADTNNSTSHCGGCNNPCPAGASCVAGMCQGGSACPTGQTICNGTCVDLTSDAANCGTCGNACGAGTVCSQSTCASGCADGLTQCGASCADVMTNAAHCGSCNNACPAGATCSAGTCQTTGSGGSGTGGTGSGGNGAGGNGTGGNTGTGGSGGGDGEPLGGYHTSGDWAGFAFTFTDEGNLASISPSNFEDMVDTDGPYCVSGTVAATEEYESIAALGFNVSQPKVDDAEVKLLDASGDGLMVDITVNELTPPTSEQDPSLRIQLEDLTDPEADDAADHRWCANVQPVDGAIQQVIPWTSFNTACWDGTGEDFDPDTMQLAKVVIYAPDAGPDGNEQTFDFCVNDIGPDNVMSRGTGTIMDSCPSNGTSWSQSGITDQFAKIGDGAYQFQSNLWNLVNGSSSLSLIPGGGFRFDQQSCSTDSDAPCSFPSVYIGTNAGGDARSSGFSPTQISAINSVPTCLGWDSGGTPASDEYNVAYDVWFNSNSGASSAEKFLMVWFRDPPSFQPGGMFPVADGVVIGDQTWQVWDGIQHEGRNVISYVAPNGLADGQAYSFDLKDFIDDAVERDVLTPSQYLISVMGGMEVWGGAQGASITGFTAEVQ